MPDVSQAEVWELDLDPAIGREQRGRRLALVISVDGMNHGPIGIAIAVPITKIAHPEIPTRVPIDPPEGGLKVPSFIICEQVRAMSTERFLEHWGTVRPETLRKVLRLLRLLTRPPG